MPSRTPTTRWASATCRSTRNRSGARACTTKPNSTSGRCSSPLWTPTTRLGQEMAMFRTDKISHGYLPTYLEIAARIQEHSPGVICELGVDVGGSLAMWQSLFPHGMVIGVDHSPDAGWPEGTFTIVADQADPQLWHKIYDLVMEEGHGAVDLLVDDASHDSGPTRESLRNLWPIIKPGGWYVIEDWGVGFPAWRLTDGGMLDLAKMLLHSFELDPQEAPLQNVDSITYRDGLIIIRKAR